MANGTFLRVRQARGEPVRVGGRTLTPIALTVHAQAVWAGKAGLAFAWGRPLAVEVEEDGRARRLGVPGSRLQFGPARSAARLLLSRLARGLMR